MFKNKKGVSLIISYILLIVLSLTLAIFVFNWLRGFVPSMDEAKCPEGVSLIISKTELVSHAAHGGPTSHLLNITVQNRGRFSVDGFYIRANNKTEPNFGIYLLNRTGVPVEVGEKNSTLINTSIYLEGQKNLTLGGTVQLIEIQPFIIDNGLVLCEAVSRTNL